MPFLRDACLCLSAVPSIPVDTCAGETCKIARHFETQPSNLSTFPPASLTHKAQTNVQASNTEFPTLLPPTGHRLEPQPLASELQSVTQGTPTHSSSLNFRPSRTSWNQDCCHMLCSVACAAGGVTDDNSYCHSHPLKDWAQAWVPASLQQKHCSCFQCNVGARR